MIENIFKTEENFEKIRYIDDTCISNNKMIEVNDDFDFIKKKKIYKTFRNLENLGPLNLDTSSKIMSQNESDDGKNNKDKTLFKGAARRKSCCCKLCGGMSNLEGKIMHIVLPNRREAAIKNLLDKRELCIQSTIDEILKLKSKSYYLQIS